MHISIFPTFDKHQKAAISRAFRPQRVEIINISPTGRNAAELRQAILDQEPDAIVLKPSGPPHTETVRDLGRERGLPVIEAIRASQERDSGWRSAVGAERRLNDPVSGFGVRNDKGQLTEIADGSLSRDNSMSEAEAEEQRQRLDELEQNDKRKGPGRK